MDSKPETFEFLYYGSVFLMCFAIVGLFADLIKNLIAVSSN